MESLTVAIVEKLGTLGIVFVIWYLTHLQENRRWARQQADASVQRKSELAERESARLLEQQERDKDRSEHMEKWNSMMKSQMNQFEQLMKNQELERERNHELFDRQAHSLEILALNTAKITDQISTAQYCPLVKETQG